MTSEEAEQEHTASLKSPGVGPSTPSCNAAAELGFVDTDIRLQCEQIGVYPYGLPTQMQLVKELRLLRMAIEKATPPASVNLKPQKLNPSELQKIAHAWELHRHLEQPAPVILGSKWEPPEIDQSALDGIINRNRISHGQEHEDADHDPSFCGRCVADEMAITDRYTLLEMLQKIRGG